MFICADKKLEYSKKVKRDAPIQKLNNLPIFISLLRSAYWRVTWRSPMFICCSHLRGNNCCSESKTKYPGYKGSGTKVLPIQDQSWVSLSCQSWCFTMFLWRQKLIQFNPKLEHTEHQRYKNFLSSWDNLTYSAAGHQGANSLLWSCDVVHLYIRSMLSTFRPDGCGPLQAGMRLL